MNNASPSPVPSDLKVDCEILSLLRCPVTGEPLRQEGDYLVSLSGTTRFRVNESGFPLFAEEFCSPEGRAQQQHYDRIAAAYLGNLEYPHTIEYMNYLDRVFLDQLKSRNLGNVAEICCGRGEAFRLVGNRVNLGVGIDVSVSMLEAAQRDLTDRRFKFVQGDATQLPIADSQFDNVVMLGGIHHVKDRHRLFSEINRILKPGGRFLWREPLSDFLLWRALRAIVYRLSPTLDHETERPLTWLETAGPLKDTGFRLMAWRPCGFLGFCFLMNSDVLVINRLFRFIPGIRGITRLMASLDDRLLQLPGLRHAGLIVVGMAEKP